MSAVVESGTARAKLALVLQPQAHANTDTPKMCVAVDHCSGAHPARGPGLLLAESWGLAMGTMASATSDASRRAACSRARRADAAELDRLAIGRQFLQLVTREGVAVREDYSTRAAACGTCRRPRAPQDLVSHV